VVYTSDKGVSTLLAEKRIDKAGGGGSSDLSILTVGGKDYTLPLFNGTWNMLKNNVSLSGSSYQIQTNAIYYQDGNYWVAYDFESLSTENAADPNFTIEDINSLYNIPTHQFDFFVKIDTSRVLTIDNTDLGGSVRVFKSDVIPVERGALYNDGTSLYVNMNVTGTGAIGGFGGLEYINGDGWRLIGTLTS
jgi:porphobilinogen synthase